MTAATAEQQPDTAPKVKPSKVSDPEQFRMSIGEHLEELRTRLIRALVGFVVVFLVCFYFGKPLTAWFCLPLYDTLEARRMQPQVYVTEVGEAFMVDVRISLIVAVSIASPWVLYQAWMFVATGLYPTERKWVTKYIPLSVSLLIGGMAFAYFVVLPWTLGFFIDWMQDVPIPQTRTAQIADADLPTTRFTLPVYNGDPASPRDGELWVNKHQNRIKLVLGDDPDESRNKPGEPKKKLISVLQLQPSNLLAPHIRLDDYIDSVVMMLIVFGASFQLPLVVMALAKVGIVEKSTLKSKRKIVYFILFIIAAAITPGDAITATIGLSIPLALLYELGIWLAPNPEPDEDTPAPA
jgi:sec-independent protein translocase protein TatC